MTGLPQLLAVFLADRPGKILAAVVAGDLLDCRGLFLPPRRRVP
ncbi:MAG: hypothetical protein WDM84_05985 [Bauldia sp.]